MSELQEVAEEWKCVCTVAGLSSWHFPREEALNSSTELEITNAAVKGWMCLLLSHPSSSSQHSDVLPTRAVVARFSNTICKPDPKNTWKYIVHIFCLRFWGMWGGRKERNVAKGQVKPHRRWGKTLYELILNLCTENFYVFSTSG